jgi:hypothetical protein
MTSTDRLDGPAQPLLNHETPTQTVAPQTVAPPTVAPATDEPWPPPRLASPPPRRRRWIVLGAVLAALVIAIPLAGYLLANRDSSSSVTSGGPATNPPAVNPSTGAPVGQAATPGGAGGAGGILRADLLSGTFDIPAWPADTPWPASAKLIKQVRFTNGRSAPGPDGAWVGIGKILYSDVNRDGRLETLALLSLTYQGSTDQVAVFTRNASGAIVPFGQVLATHPNGPLGVVKTIGDLRPASAGRIEVRVGDDVPCCGVGPDQVLYQWRTYAWTGDAFTQVAGPTAFGVDTRFADLALQPTRLTLSAPVSDVRHGVLGLTISGHGTVTARQMQIRVILLDTGLTAEGPSWAGFTRSQQTWQATLDAPAPGQRVTLQLGVSRPVSQDGATGTVTVMLWPLDLDGNVGKDGWFADNIINVPVVLAG